MAKFCKQCGNQLADEAMFCKSCGAKVEAEPVQPNYDNANQQCDCGCAPQEGQNCTQKEPNAIANAVNGFIGKVKSKDTTSIIILAAIPTVLILGLVLALVFGGNGAEGAIDNYAAAAFEGDGDVAEDLAPEAFWDWADDERDVDIKDVEDNIVDINKMTLKLLEMGFGDDVSIDYEITDEDELSERKLDDIKDVLKDRYDISKKDVTEAIEYEIEITYEGDKDEDSEDLTIIAVEIDGDWYPVLENGRFAVEEFLSGTGFGALGDIDLDDLDDLVDYGDFGF